MINFIIDSVALAAFLLPMVGLSVVATWAAYKLMERPNSRAGAWLRRFFGFDD